jgi:hypothetical protein
MAKKYESRACTFHEHVDTGRPFPQVDARDDIFGAYRSVYRQKKSLGLPDMLLAYYLAQRT